MSFTILSSAQAGLPSRVRAQVRLCSIWFQSSPPRRRAEHTVTPTFKLPIGTAQFQSSPAPKSRSTEGLSLNVTSWTGFNPLRLRRAGATSFLMPHGTGILSFQSSPAPKSRSNFEFVRRHELMEFQSSPAPKSRSNWAPRPECLWVVSFQSSPAPKSREQRQAWLLSPRQRLRRVSFNPLRPRRAGATRTRPALPSSPRWFQSSPAPKSRSNIGWATNQEGCTSFNPLRPRRAGATGSSCVAGYDKEVFNPLRPRRAGATPADDKVRPALLPVSILSGPEEPEQLLAVKDSSRIMAVSILSPAPKSRKTTCRRSLRRHAGRCFNPLRLRRAGATRAGSGGDCR